MEIITAATILLTSLNVFNEDCRFAYQTERSGDIVTSTIVYKKSEDGNLLSHHLKYKYTYDEQQRLVKKEILKWNFFAEKWENSYCLNYMYDTFGYSIEYALWNKAKADYNNVIAKQTYDEKINGAVAVAFYKWNKNDKNWVAQSNTLMMNPGEKFLSLFELKL